MAGVAASLAAGGDLATDEEDGKIIPGASIDSTAARIKLLDASSTSSKDGLLVLPGAAYAPASARSESKRARTRGGDGRVKLRKDTPTRLKPYLG